MGNIEKNENNSVTVEINILFGEDTYENFPIS